MTVYGSLVDKPNEPKSVLCKICGVFSGGLRERIWSTPPIFSTAVLMQSVICKPYICQSTRMYQQCTPRSERYQKYQDVAAFFQTFFDQGFLINAYPADSCAISPMAFLLSISVKMSILHEKHFPSHLLELNPRTSFSVLKISKENVLVY